MLDNKKIKHIHCIGIGGIGVSAIAEILFKKGYFVSGSDVAENKNTVRLEKLGVHITVGHARENCQHADAVIYSSAIAPDNPEFLAAQQAGTPLYKRGQALAELMQDYYSIAIAGTHGKTTSCSIMAHCLLACGVDPSFAVGGVLNATGSPVNLGASRYFVAEADESDASFLLMNPNVIVVTNIDADHLETYGGDFDCLKASFVEFLQKIPSDGAAILCMDNAVVRELIPQLQCNVVTYGFHPEADFSVRDFSQVGLQSCFTVQRPDSLSPLSIKLPMPGQHNILNALPTVVVAHLINIDDDKLSASMASFSGVGRRFHCHGEMVVKDGCALVVEDYGHHPNEVKATLLAAKLAWPNRRVVLAFQPHRYTRTRDLMQEFIDVLSEADLLILLDIYSAGESPIAGVSGQSLYHSIEKKSKNRPIFASDLAALPAELKNILQNDDVIILQGAGSVGAMALTLAQSDE